MAKKVIPIPTPYNMTNGMEGKSIEVVTESYDDGTVMVALDGVEMWLELEQATELLDCLSEAVADAFDKLRAHVAGLTRDKG